MTKIIITLLSLVWILNGNTMESNHSQNRVPPLNFDTLEKMERSPLRGYSVLCQEESKLYNYCDDVFFNERCSDSQQEVMKNFAELLNKFLKLEYPFIIKNIGIEAVAEYIKGYLDTNHDKVQRIQSHKDLLATLEDKASTNVAKKVFSWLKNDTTMIGLYQIIGLA